MIDCSSNELQMLVLKACRGIDLPFSQAQEVAAAIAVSPKAIPDFLKYLYNVLLKVHIPLSFYKN